MRKFLARFRKKPSAELVPLGVQVVEARPIEGWSAADGIGFYDTHPTLNGAERVRSLLDLYADAHDRNEPLETVAADFLADLFHLLEEEGESPEAIVSSAELHFHAERDAEPVFA
jgi:hypothetical protein